MAIEIVDFPINSMVIFHGKMLVHQRVSVQYSDLEGCKIHIIRPAQLVGGFNPSEKYESQLGWLFPIYGKIKNVWNHQPVKLRPDPESHRRYDWTLWTNRTQHIHALGGHGRNQTGHPSTQNLGTKRDKGNITPCYLWEWISVGNIMGQ